MGTDKPNVVEAVEVAFLMLRSRLMLRADSLSECQELPDEASASTI